MTVSELMTALATMDPNAEVRWLDVYADEDESDSVCEVHAYQDWTHETGAYGSETYEVWYPGPQLEPRGAGYRNVVLEPVRSVVMLSSGPTNLTR